MLQSSQSLKALESAGTTTPELANLELTSVDMEDIYIRCFQALDFVYKNEFKKSIQYLTLLKEMNENIIEYRFFSHAGLSLPRK